MSTKTESKSKKQRASRAPRPDYILLGLDESWRNLFGKSRSVICSSEREILDVLPKVMKDVLWISSQSAMTDELLRATASVANPVGNLLMLKHPRPKTLPLLHSRFGTVIGESPSFKFLPSDQLADILSLPKDVSQDLFIGGGVDKTSGLISLVRGNLQRIVVPLSIFRRSGTSRPNFGKFEIGEFGHSIKFGDYEAAGDFILYEVDKDYRKRMDAKRRAEEKGFGYSLRRLRIQRGLARDDFPGVSSKAIARLERGEVEKPQRKTLATICEALGVSPDEIESY